MQLNRTALTAPFAVAALLALLALAVPAFADLQQELEEKQAKLEKVHARKGVLTTTISRYRDRIDRLAGEVATIRGEEAGARARLAVKQEALDRAVAELDGAKERLDSARAHLKRALVGLRERLVAMYETGTPDVFSFIVGSTDYGDLATRTEYLNRLHGMDDAVVNRVRELRDEVQHIVERLRGAKDRIQAARDAVAAEAQALIDARQALQGRQAALLSARADRVALLKKISTHEEELDGSVAAIQGKIAAQIAGVGSEPLPVGPVRYGGGNFIWPVDGPVVSGFGGRDIGAGYEDHPGIDIAVPSGTPIRAAADGTVVLLQPEASSGGYGNFTCIDHGGGISTCYAHQTSFAVSAGQTVSQGAVIGYVGCTGYCLGPHLHFEVRINGVVTDPMGYL